MNAYDWQLLLVAVGVGVFTGIGFTLMAFVYLIL
jgi:hypothetical protein